MNVQVHYKQHHHRSGKNILRADPHGNKVVDQNTKRNNDHHCDEDTHDCIQFECALFAFPLGVGRQNISDHGRDRIQKTRDQGFELL